MIKDALINRIEEDLKYIQLDHRDELSQLTKNWGAKLAHEPKKFINPDLTINLAALEQFRRDQIFVTDEPSFAPGPLNPLNIISGARRGAVSLLKNSVSVLKDHGYDQLLKKYPANRIGGANLFRYQGYEYTHRWARHIYFLGLFNDHLKNILPPGFTALDIGASYGIFSGLLKAECPQSHHLVLDFSEQIILAHYYLGRRFPGARIAGFKEVVAAGKIDRKFIEKYDFVLVPWYLYHQIQPKSLDLITNFVSFAEMKRKWFDYYLKSEPFLSSEYFYSVNRFQSWPTHDTDLTILDYPLNEFAPLHFRINPFLTHDCQPKFWIFWQKAPYNSQFFEFIGKRKQEHGHAS